MEKQWLWEKAYRITLGNLSHLGGRMHGSLPCSPTLPCFVVLAYRALILYLQHMARVTVMMAMRIMIMMLMAAAMTTA